MEGEVCQFQKFGFCKFKGGCKRKHLTQICESLLRCKDINKCEKRHPKNCKKFASGNGCKHHEKCAYNHHVTKYDEEQNELKDKVGILEKKIADMTKKDSKETSQLEKLEMVVKALTRKVLSLENETRALQVCTPINGYSFKKLSFIKD